MKIYIVAKDFGNGIPKPMWAYDNAEDALKSARQDALDNEVMEVIELTMYPTQLREMLA